MAARPSPCARGFVLRQRARRRAARELIDARQYVLDSDWGDVQPTRRGAERLPRAPLLGASTPSGTSASPTGAHDETKARYAFVYGDFRRIHRIGLIACLYRAAEWRHKEVELAAHDLLQQLDARSG